MSYTQVNKNAKVIFWIAFALSIFGMILPVVYLTSGFVSETYQLFDVLSDMGILFYLAGVGCLFAAARNSEIGNKTRRFGFGSAILMLLPYGAVQSFIDDANYYLGYGVAESGPGSGAIIFSIILAVIASFMTKNTLEIGRYPYPNRGYGYGPSQGYQQPPGYANRSGYQQPHAYQQGGYQQPVNPPSYQSQSSSSSMPTAGVQASYCGNCGARTNNNDAFCNSCGTKL